MERDKVKLYNSQSYFCISNQENKYAKKIFAIQTHLYSIILMINMRRILHDLPMSSTSSLHPQRPIFCNPV